jgi:glutathione peroxidase-family protein
MKRFTNVSAIFVLLFAAAAVAKDGQEAASKSEPPAVATVGKPAPDFTLADAQSQKHQLSTYKGKYVVLEWVNFDCPFVRNHYGAGNMQALQAKYTGNDVVWLTICSSAPGKQGYFEGEELVKRIEKEGSKSTAYLVDADGTVGHLYEAKTTPHVFVINPEGTLIYAGAIDDKPSTKPEDLKQANNYVAAVLTAATARKSVETASTQSYGCAVKYK